MITFNPLEESVRTHSAGKLLEILSAFMNTATASKLSHWNIRGVLFQPIHVLFDDVFALSVKGSDVIGERIGQLGSMVDCATDDFKKLASTTDLFGHVSLMISRLSNLSGLMVTFIKEHQDTDPISADIVTALCTDVDKYLWFLESHVLNQSKMDDTSEEETKE